MVLATIAFTSRQEPPKIHAQKVISNSKPPEIKHLEHSIQTINRHQESAISCPPMQHNNIEPDLKKLMLNMTNCSDEEWPYPSRNRFRHNWELHGMRCRATAAPPVVVDQPSSCIHHGVPYRSVPNVALLSNNNPQCDGFPCLFCLV